MKTMRLIQIFMTVTVVFSGTGCKFIAALNDHSGRMDVPGQVSEMPSVTMTDLDATGRKLSAAGLTILVKRPELAIKTDRKNNTAALKFPERIQPFEPSRWNHLIAAQHPPPGTSLRSGSVITLTAGIHHGAGPFRPWLDAHGGSVSLRGEQRCRDCHTKLYCTECHQKLYLPTKAQ